LFREKLNSKDGAKPIFFQEKIWVLLRLKNNISGCVRPDILLIQPQSPGGDWNIRQGVKDFRHEIS
jgi:hypothetical protein